MYKIVTFKLWYFAFSPIKTHSITILAPKDIQTNVQGPLKHEIIRFVKFINVHLLDSSALYDGWFYTWNWGPMMAKKVHLEH